MATDRPRTSVTLHDVAREAGVSLATASRSLNGSDRKVNDAYRERVLAAAARLDYRPNLSAQAVARGSTTAVALVVSDIADPYFSSIASGVMRGAEEAGLIVTMSVTGRDTDRELALVRALRGQRPRVIILAGSRYGDGTHTELATELEGFERGGGRVVLISQHEMPFDTVLIDNRGGARRLAEALVEQGYRRFAALVGNRALLTVRDRLAGFTEGLAAHGLELVDDRVTVDEFTRDGGYRATRALIERGVDDLDLIFAVNDVMAIGALSALRDAGLEPGRDVAVAGFDDIPTVRDVTPALTTVRVPLIDAGRAALEVALRPRENGEHTIEVGAEVVLRASTPPRG